MVTDKNEIIVKIRFFISQLVLGKYYLRQKKIMASAVYCHLQFQVVEKHYAAGKIIMSGNIDEFT